MDESFAVETFEINEGLRVAICRRADGLVDLWEEARQWEEPHPAIGEGYFYWVPVGAKSLLGTREEALHEVANRYPPPSAGAE